MPETRRQRPAPPPRRPTQPIKVKNQSNYYHQAQNLFRLSGSVIPKVFFPAILITAWGAIWTVFFMVDEVNFLKGFLPKSTLLITIVSLVMGLLLVFRNNTAYERYWEGRRLWGTLETQVRNMSRFIWIGVSAKNAQDALEKRGAMNLLVAYMHATKHYLRNELGLHYDDIYPFISHLPEFAMDNQNQPDIKNLPLEISFQLGGYIMKAKEHGQIDVSQLGCMTNSLNAMIECFTGFERIRNTPLPFAYSIHLKQTLIVYLLSLPFQLVVDNKWGTIPVTLLAAFTLLGLEAIGGEIENPFGLDENDLPIDDICEMIHQEVLSIMDRPDKLDSSKWGLPWEDLNSTHANLDESAISAAQAQVKARMPFTKRFIS
ncbi:uncharacterized protein SPPG_06910 [Spizellomyces punctatus DAOM BR117]|uniref:Uncharacterized protein n=1 Tax=Spizellomyces punctatus (strain DAOM BR117) TaxID=645134 RepID=A0A0L0H8Q9_SPIPD|nr:uncharacterized protein SPPG_06910 [Spizellomyces punctatus DAOM BR117]KNC97920.1 hypothetical protein SPPG_06910 [Spizellomyces punctatus DAOM BR117]|eukprot:XP_016605960.1 hypothetical protein SPPG_06910 [Spizellomyces punctatus DAOM BR117]